MLLPRCILVSLKSIVSKKYFYVSVRLLSILGLNTLNSRMSKSARRRELFAASHSFFPELLGFL
jgi:hypothetical protein